MPESVEPGRVVVLNGTSSAGKTTLARAVQRMADTPWVVMGQDDFAQSLSPTWVKVDGTFDGGRGEDGFHFVRSERGDLHVEAGPVGRRMLRGYRFAVAACARAGNDVIVDECKFDSDGWAEWSEALAALDVMWVRVECSLEVCSKRELARSDRAALAGLARGQYERAHAGATYELTVDLSDDDIEGAAAAVLSAVQHRHASSL